MSTELVPYTAFDAIGDLVEVVNENLGGEGISPQDLPRVKIPSGGGAFWEVPSIDGVEAQKQITGIVVHTALNRAYWPNRNATGEPPACRSSDAVTGVGEPGGACATCELAQFGSSDTGRGQACTLRRSVFILTPKAVLPIMLNLPPTSLRAWRSFVIGLTTAGVSLNSVEITFGLEAAKAADGQDYSRATFKVSRRLEDVEAAQAKDYGSTIRPLLLAAVEAGE